MEHPSAASVLETGRRLGDVGSLSATMTCDALRITLFRRHRPRGVIAHSDRGSQYCSRQYRQLLKHNGLNCSMSARGDCYDNAAMEGWDHRLRVQAVHGERFITRAGQVTTV